MRMLADVSGAEETGQVSTHLDRDLKASLDQQTVAGSDFLIDPERHCKAI